MHSMTLFGGGGTKTALPGRDPPIQFWEVRNSPGALVLPRPFDRRILCISLRSRSDKGKPPRKRSRPWFIAAT